MLKNLFVFVIISKEGIRLIGEYTLKMLCDKYGISSDKIVNKNNNILLSGEYQEIDNTLNFLINKLNISSDNIEKCPSVLYRNVDAISKNVDFLRQQKMEFSSIESCLHVLATKPNELVETYQYIERHYGILELKNNTSTLSCNKKLITEVEKLNLDRRCVLSVAVGIEFGSTSLEDVQKILNSDEYKMHPKLFTSETLNHAKLEDIQKMLNSPEYREHSELFTSQTLARAKIEDIQEMLGSDECREHPELFTSQTLAYAKLEDIQKMLESDEYREHSELFTSQTLAHAKLEDIQEMLESDEYREHPELFTSTTLAHAKIKDIQKMLKSDEYREHSELFTSETLVRAKIEDIKEMLGSDEYREHPELFTSTTLSHVKIKDIQEMVKSDEYREHPELFTSETLVRAKIEDIQEILKSDEYKEHPELFTSETLARAKLEDIKEMLHSDEYRVHSELFTSQTLARAKIEDIRKLLKMPEWEDVRFKKLLTSTIVSRAKQMIKKVSILIALAEEYQIDNYLNTSFFILSPSQNYALINYLIDNNLPLVIGEKLNPIFGKQPGVLKKRYNIDVKELIKKYPLNKKIEGKRR